MHTDFEAPSTSSKVWKGYLEVRLGNGPVEKRPLADPPIVIGRSPNVPVSLDHDTVSRRHAELYCDPFGRWWIRDLASTNGTLVNGERVTERVLRPGDRIRVGDFHLALVFPTDGRRRDEGREGLAAWEQDRDSHTAIRTLGEGEQPRIAATHLFTLMNLSRSLLGVEDPLERLNTACQLLVGEDFRGSVAMVLRVREGGQYTVLSGPHRPHDARETAMPYISRSILKRLHQTAEPVMASNATALGGHAPSNLELTISRHVLAVSIAACPLQREGDEIDVLYVMLPPNCGTVEWLALIALAGEAYLQAETAWEARRHAQAHAAIEHELEMARQIQHALVPRNPRIAGLDVAIGFEPCKWVGGDYVDVVPMPDGRTLLAVADVCGKGLQAALVSSSLHTLVRATVDAGRTPVELMDRLNAHFGEYLPEHSFITMVVVAVDPKTGALECVNAGHPPGILVSRNGSMRYLQVAMNPALGVASLPMEAQVERLDPGDVLAMYTDGLTELRNASGDMLGLQLLGSGFTRICMQGPSQSAAEVAYHLNLLLEQFRGDRMPEDDRAFLVARRR